MTDSNHSFVPSRLAPPGRATASDEMGSVSGLEKALAGSEAEAREAINAAGQGVKNLAERVERALRRGASSNEFATLSALARACEAAQDILNKVSPSNQQSAKM